MFELSKSRFIIFFLILTFSLNARSPYELRWERELAISGLGSVIGMTGYLLENNVNPLNSEELSHLNKMDINIFDRSATSNYNTALGDISDIGIYTLISSPALLFLSGDIRNDIGTVATMYLETLAFMYALPSVFKGSVTRYRPFVYNPEAPIEKKLDADAIKSYFSGHTTVAFASAVFISTLYSEYYPGSKYKSWVWGGSILIAATIGYLRYASGNHYPTDILTGALVGSAIGYLVPYLHKTENEDNLNTSAIMGTDGFSFGFSIQL
jgi:membrane-associated phospholipid phosphatase